MSIDPSIEGIKESIRKLIEEKAELHDMSEDDVRDIIESFAYINELIIREAFDAGFSDGRAFMRKSKK